MIPMLSCLFCKRKRRLFNIYKIYGRTERPITSYIISFFGDVEEYLKQDHGICSTCVLLLNKLIYIKNFMIKTIIDDSVNTDSYVSFSSAYKLFLHNLDKLNFDDGDVMEDGGVSDLLKPMHSTPCEIDYDYSSDRNTPYIDKEVEKVFKPEKRKRRRSTKSIADDDVGASPPCLRYDEDGRLLNKRTRSVSRLLNAMQEDVNCGEKEKDHFERDHVSHHELLAKYFCCECRSGRFTALDFVHDKAPEEMTNFYRIDYNDHPKNNLNSNSENKNGDFHVKVLIQKGKICESPVLRFQESPEVTNSITPSINTITSSRTQSRQNSDDDIDDDNNDSELDTGQENSSITSERNDSVQLMEESSEENDNEKNSDDDFNNKSEEDIILEEDEVIEENKKVKIIEETEEEKTTEENEEDKTIQESEEDKIIEENEEDQIIEENEEDKIIEEISSIEEDKIIEESEEDEKNSHYVPSALEPERMVRDIIDSSSSESEMNEENLHVEKFVNKELKVVVTRMIIDEALLTRLNRFPTNQWRRRSRRRRGSQRSRSRDSQRSRSSESGEFNVKINFRTDTEDELFDSD